MSKSKPQSPFLDEATGSLPRQGISNRRERIHQATASVAASPIAPHHGPSTSRCCASEALNPSTIAAAAARASAARRAVGHQRQRNRGSFVRDFTINANAPT